MRRTSALGASCGASTGAEIGFAFQTLPLYRREVREEGAGPAERESIGLAIALSVAEAFQNGATPWTDDGLS